MKYFLKIELSFYDFIIIFLNILLSFCNLSINYKYAIIDIRDIPCESFLKSDNPSASFRNYLEKVEVFSTNRDLEQYIDKGEAMLAVDIEKLPSFNRGLEKGILFVAKQMLKANMDRNIVQKMTNLSLLEIELLEKEIQSEKQN